ncbi:hypothetical protein L6164_014323 [Bauhinia variegata]|uniref:Uncharacterized protein n=1 Tax=Bauhinia variegata TaxID=167791 RepID=A0ACB9NHV6_BAUVA|nr:hypothetical protein L6164_014323 [Bauhinia variegata]
MANSMNLAILLLALAAMLQTTLATDHIVGGSIGWHPNGPTFFADWAANQTFRLNDVLVFNFTEFVHDVVVLNKENFDNCSFGKKVETFSTPPVRITLNRTGEFYFACEYTGHCTLGQKLAVNVSAFSPSEPAPAPGSSANSPPGSTGTTAPPPQNAATPLAATFSLLLIAIATAFLFQF